MKFKISFACALALLIQSFPQAIFCATSEDKAEQIQLKSAEWMVQTRRANLLIKAGKYADAETILKKMLSERQELECDLGNERCALGGIYSAQNKNDLAQEQYKAFLAEREKESGGQDDVTVAYALNQYADFLAKVGRQDEAQKLRARAKIAQNPPIKQITATDGETPAETALKWRAQGMLFLQKSQPQKALTCLNKALALNANDAVALCGRGEAYEFIDNGARALSDYNQSLKLDPKYAHAYYLRGMLYESRKNYPKALADFGCAIENDAKDTGLLGARAKLMDNLGRHKEAIADYAQALAVDSTLRWAHVQRAVAYEGLHDYRKAIADYDVLVERYPDAADYREFRGAAFLKAGDYQKALADYNRVIALKQKYAGGYLGRALTYVKIDGKKSARAQADYALAHKYGWIDTAKKH